MLCYQGVLRVVLIVVFLVHAWYICGILLALWNSQHGLPNQEKKPRDLFIGLQSHVIFFATLQCSL